MGRTVVETCSFDCRTIEDADVAFQQAKKQVKRSIELNIYYNIELYSK